MLSSEFFQANGICFPGLFLYFFAFFAVAVQQDAYGLILMFLRAQWLPCRTERPTQPER
jgi:hypothetical protein